MHPTPTRRAPLTALALAAMATLAGCGGGSSSADNDDTMKIGDQYAVQVYDANDALLSEATRKIFGVTATGQLIDNPADSTLMPGATATLPVTGGQTELDRLELDAEAFLASFLTHAMQRGGYKSTRSAWEDVLDQDMPLDEVMADFRQSGLDMAGFINFYAAIDEAKVVSFDDRAEQDVRDWLQAAQANQSELLAVLGSFDMQWPDFLALVAARRDSLQGLRIRQQNLQGDDALPKAASACKASHPQVPGLCDLISRYLNEPAPKSAQAKAADPATAAMTAAVEAAKLKLEIAKFTWQVIKENRPSIDVDTGAARTSILSASDKDPLSYEYAKLASSGTRKIVICTKVLSKCIKDWAKVEMHVSGTHQAQHASHKGQWIPSVQLETPSIWAFAGQKVNLSAYVTNPSNLGARDDALPYAEIVADMTVSGNITSDRIQTKFTVHGKDGFKLAR